VHHHTPTVHCITPCVWGGLHCLAATREGSSAETPLHHKLAVQGLPPLATTAHVLCSLLLAAPSPSVQRWAAPTACTGWQGAPHCPCSRAAELEGAPHCSRPSGCLCGLSSGRVSLRTAMLGGRALATSSALHSEHALPTASVHGACAAVVAAAPLDASPVSVPAESTPTATAAQPSARCAFRSADVEASHASGARRGGGWRAPCDLAYIVTLSSVSVLLVSQRSASPPVERSPAVSWGAAMHARSSAHAWSSATHIRPRRRRSIQAERRFNAASASLVSQQKGHAMGGRLRTLGGAVRLIGGRAHAAPTARTALPLLGAPRNLWPSPVSAGCPPTLP